MADEPAVGRLPLEETQYKTKTGWTVAGFPFLTKMAKRESPLLVIITVSSHAETATSVLTQIRKSENDLSGNR